MCGTALAASSRSTVMRTISEPARASAAAWRTVPSDVGRVGVGHRLHDDRRVAADDDAADVDGDGRPARGEGAGHGLTATRVVRRTLACPSRQLRIGASRPDRHCVAGGQAAAAGCGPGFAPILRSAWLPGIFAGFHALADQGFRPPRLAAGLAYLAWPVFAALEIREAIVAGDTAALNRKIDWEALRASLKASITPETLARLTRILTRPSRRLWQRIKAAVAPSMADTVIDRYVTPENLPVLLGYRRVYRRHGAARRSASRSRRPSLPAPGSRLEPRSVRQLLDPGAPRRLPLALPLRARGGGQASPRPALRRHA